MLAGDAGGGSTLTVAQRGGQVPPARPYHRVIWHGTRSEPGDSIEPVVHPALFAVSVAEVIAVVNSAWNAACQADAWGRHNHEEAL
jgi:hypothetical protein